MRVKLNREYGGMPTHERIGLPPRAVIKELLTTESPPIAAWTPLALE